MKWATRRNIHVDRAATAWLIASFIDANAEFLYVDELADVPEDATAFDMRGCELTHVGDDITFETVLRRYDLVDPVLWQMARIIHQADLEDDRFDAPEAPGLDLVVRALGSNHSDEEVRMLTSEVLTSVEVYLRKQALGG